MALDANPKAGAPFRSGNACAFCGAGKGPDRRLVAGAGVAVCDRCVAVALEVLVEDRDGDAWFRLVPDRGGEQAAACSFCGKALRRVGRLVRAEHGTHVCGECLDLCTEILREDTRG
jgi:ATP-dependent protease Clp ATPase subunit